MAKRKQRRSRPDYRALFTGSEKISDNRAERIERLENNLAIETRSKHLVERQLELSKAREEKLEASLEIERRMTDRLIARLMRLLAEAVPTIAPEE